MRPSRINCSLYTEFSLVQENILIQNERITQLYVIQSEQNPFLWFGVLFVDTGIYLGSVIRFTIYIDDTYPNCPCPKLVFDPIPYHPLVNPLSGELDTKNAFPHWNSESRKLFELLLFAKRVIRQADEYIKQIRDLISNSSSHEDQIIKSSSTSYAPATTALASGDNQLLLSDDPGSQNIIETVSLDTGQSNYKTNQQQEETSAFKNSIALASSSLESMFSWFHHTLDFIDTYENNTNEFDKKIEEFKQKCYEQLFDRPALCGDDCNALVFTPWNLEEHGPIRDCVLAGRFTPSSLFASYHRETESVSFIPGREHDLE